MIAQVYQCICGHRFEEGLGKYGCPNCNGASGGAPLVCEVHDKAYSSNILTSDPPKKMWICRVCLEEGLECCGPKLSIQLETYDQALDRKLTRQAENPKPVENPWTPQRGD